MTKSFQSFFTPFHVLSSGCCCTRYVGTYQPMLPLGPSSPASTTLWLPLTYWAYSGEWPHTSITAETLPWTIAGQAGISSIVSRLTL